MKNLYFIATLIFWLTIVSFWVALSWSPESDNAIDRNPIAVYSLSEVTKHNQQTDCWMAIHGQVYDLTLYLPQHPTTLRVILPSCGTEASHAYDTKNRNREHTNAADTLLEHYRIGVLKN